MKVNTLEYKGYVAKLHFDFDDNIIVGRVVNANEIISFHADNTLEIKQAFEDAINDYVEVCIKHGIEPAKPHSGTFSLRLTSELHRELSVEAAQEGISLNDLARQLLKFGLSHRHQGDSPELHA